MVKRLIKKSRFNLALTLARAYLFFLILSFQPSLAAPASAWVTPAVVAVDETVTLTIAQDSFALNAPELSVLKDNFKILKQTTSSSINKVNGVTVIKKRWVLILLPLKTGKLTIPAIQIGEERTPPLNLKVMDDRVNSGIETRTNNKTIDNTSTHEIALSTVAEQNIIIQVDVGQQPHYVQGQVVLSQKIFHAVPLKSAHLTTPKIKENAADIVQLSQIEPYYWNIDGKRYHVIERNYALFPKHSGRLTIEKAEFTGATKKQTKQASKEDPFGLRTSSSSKPPPNTTSVKAGTILSASAKAVTVNILPQEKSFTAHHWLPAKNITVYRKWSKSLETLNEGDTVVMQTTIIADGLRAEQLPEVFLEMPGNVKTYPEQAELTNTITHSGVTGIWSQKITFVASQSGEFMIPELKIPWWNITTEREELAQLKPEVLIVRKLASVNNQTNQALNKRDTLQPASLAAVASKPLTSTTTKEHSEESIVNQNSDNKSGINWGYLILPALLFLGYWFYRNQNNTIPKKQQHKTSHPQHIMDQLKQACLDNSPQTVEPLLLQWAKQVASIRPPTLEGISSTNNGYLRPEIERLSQSLYARSQTSWKGMSLWDAIKKYPYPKNTDLRKRDNRLKDMYPS